MGRVRNFGNKAQGAYYFGGARPVADDDFLTIAGKIFRFVAADGDEGAGEYPIVKGASLADDVAAAIVAINAHKPRPGIAAVADAVSNKGIRLIAEQPGEQGNVAYSATMTDVLNVAAGAAMVNGKNPGNRTLHAGTYTVTAQDLAMGPSVMIETGLDAPINVQSEVRRSGDLVEALTNLLTVSGSKLLYDGTGATDLTTGDKISWSAWQ